MVRKGFLDSGCEIGADMDLACPGAESARKLADLESDSRLADWEAGWGEAGRYRNVYLWVEDWWLTY